MEDRHCPSERSGCRQPLEGAKRGCPSRDHPPIGKNKAEQRETLFVGDVFEQLIGRSIGEPEKRELPSTVKLSDDPCRKPAEPAANVIEENRANHTRKVRGFQPAPGPRTPEGQPGS
jgi:hypothetical protein